MEGEELQFNLHIVNVTLPENEGKYSCQASTTSGTKEQEHYVTVNSEYKFYQIRMSTGLIFLQVYSNTQE